MVDAVQTWTPYLWPTFLIHAPVWYQHILIDTKDNPRGCACSCHTCHPRGRANPYYRGFLSQPQGAPALSHPALRKVTGVHLVGGGAPTLCMRFRCKQP